MTAVNKPLNDCPCKTGESLPNSIPNCKNFQICKGQYGCKINQQVHVLLYTHFNNEKQTLQ